MSGPEHRPADGSSQVGDLEQPATSQEEGAGPVGALDGAAAAGSGGAVSGGKRDSVMPQEAPDPTFGPD